MLKEYELWLDESGSFENEMENALDGVKFPRGFNPSLIAGWLVDYSKYRQSDFDEFVVSQVTDGEYHASGMKPEEAKHLELSSIKKIHDEFGGRIVVFQNRELMDPGNRELYLRLIAVGLLQLLQELNANSESIKLHVVIARRIDVTVTDSKDPTILDKEYKRILSEYIHSKKKEGRLMLHEDTEMSITVGSARKDNRLKMADYVCNTELTLNSWKFTKEEREQYRTYKEDAFVYSFSEDITENNIQKLLARGDVANALVETVLYTEDKTFKNILKSIGNKISEMGYRGAKVQLDQCTKEFTTYAYMEDDFERSEIFLYKLLDKVIPTFEKMHLPCEKLKFSLALLLTDMYLREGDIKRASEEMQVCRETEATLPSSLENLLYHYQLIEKEALLCIDGFDFENGSAMMRNICGGVKNLLEYIPLIEEIKDRFPNIISEYYGDALCMKIYAGLFLQRSKPDLYAELVRDSDIALIQYGPHEGELERHRQYRSVIEMQKGDFRTAAIWLLMTQKGDISMNSLADGTVPEKKDFNTFLRSVITGEGKSARRYYLMYYVKIMSEAALAGDPIADVMYSALKANKGIQEQEDLQDRSYKTEYGAELQESVISDLDNVLRPAKYIDYHPLEVNYWKQATYEYTVKNYSAALNLYGKALDVCYTYSEYIQLSVIGLGIWAEYIVCLIESNQPKKAKEKYGKLLKKAAGIEKKAGIPTIIEFVRKVRTAIEEAKTAEGINKDKMWQASRLITF